MGDYLLTHPFIEPLHDQSYFQSCTLDDRHRVLMRGILQIGVVYGENAVAHLQHVALVSGTGGNDVLDEDARDFIAPTDVHLERERGRKCRRDIRWRVNKEAAVVPRLSNVNQ